MSTELIELTCQVEVAPGEAFELPAQLKAGIGAGRWLVTVQPLPSAPSLRDHSAFLNSYGPEDEGLYDDAFRG